VASSITRLDARIVQLAQDHHAAVPDAAARTPSNLILVYVLFGVVALGLSIHRRSAPPALTAVVAVLVTEAITYTLKGLIDRSRPPDRPPAEAGA
jgi:hypothetical protein